MLEKNSPTEFWTTGKIGFAVIVLFILVIIIFVIVQLTKPIEKPHEYTKSEYINILDDDINDKATDYNVSLEKCQSLCDSNPECKGFVKGKKSLNDKCFLKKTFNNTNIDINNDFYYKGDRPLSIQLPSTYIKNSTNRNFNDPNILIDDKEELPVTLEDCKKICNQRIDCMGVIIDKNKNNGSRCWLKKGFELETLKINDSNTEDYEVHSKKYYIFPKNKPPSQQPLKVDQLKEKDTEADQTKEETDVKKLNTILEKAAPAIYIKYENVNYPNNNNKFLNNSGETEIDDCKNICAGSSECIGFVKNKNDTKSCFYKEKLGIPTENDNNHDFYIKPSIPSESTPFLYIEDKNVNFAGNDMTDLNNKKYTDIDECKKICINNPNCKGIAKNLSSGDSKCYFKHTLGPPSFNTDFNFYTKPSQYIKTNAVYVGDDIGTNINTIENCKHLCNQSTECAGFVRPILKHMDNTGNSFCQFKTNFKLGVGVDNSVDVYYKEIN